MQSFSAIAEEKRGIIRLREACATYSYHSAKEIQFIFSLEQNFWHEILRQVTHLEGER